MLEGCLSASTNVGCGEWSRKGKSCPLSLLGLASHSMNLPSMPVLGIGEAPPFGSHFANLPLMQRVVLIALFREHSALAELNFLVRGIALIWRSRRDKTQAIRVRVEETKAKQFRTRWEGSGGLIYGAAGNFFWSITRDIANWRGSHRPKIPIWLQNQSCRPSPVVWEKHGSKRSMRLGSWVFRPLFEHVLLEFLGTKTTQFRVPKRKPKHEKLKKVPRTDCPPLPSLPSVRNTFFESHL